MKHLSYVFKFSFVLTLLMLSFMQMQAQNIGIGTTSPDSSALLDMSSTDKGVLIPRMSSADRQNIENPAIGLMVFDSTNHAFYYFTGNGWLELLAGKLDHIADADGDTKIQVEESPNENIIRFDVAGTEYFRMKPSRLEPLNSGRSIFFGLDAGLNDDLSNNENIFIGENAGYSNTIGYQNIGTGVETLYNTTNGYSNIAIGKRAIYSNTTGNANTAIGPFSLYHNINGMWNIGIGENSGYFNQNGNSNVLIGRLAGFGNANHNKNNNVMIGTLAGRFSEGSGNIFLGYNAGFNELGDNRLYIENSDADSTGALIYGEFDNDWLRVNGRLTPTQGLTDADGNTKIQVEETPNDNTIRFDLGGTENFRMKNGRLDVVNNGNSVFIGENAGLADDHNNRQNVFIGKDAGSSNVSGRYNVAIGHTTLSDNVNGDYSTAVGYEALGINVSGSENTAMGANALSSNTSGAYNSAVGRYALQYNVQGQSNVGIGYLAGAFNENGYRNVFLGAEAGKGFSLHTKSDNVVLGYKAGYAATGNGNVFIGAQAGGNAAGNNKLYIENTSSATPLIYGEFDNDLVRVNGDFEVTQDATVSGDLNTTGKVKEAGYDLLPVGSIIMWPANSIPSNWLQCNGFSFTSGLYPELYAVLGTNVLPDLTGRVPLGAGNSGENGSTSHSLGSTGGEETHTLTIAEMPAHHHVFYYQNRSKGGSGPYVADLAGDNSSAKTTTDVGGSQPHNNLPPFYTLKFIIKAK